MPKPKFTSLKSFVLLSVVAMTCGGAPALLWAQSGSRDGGVSARGHRSQAAHAAGSGSRATAGSREHAASGAARHAGDAPVALEGYCPVCLKKMRKWVKGDPAYRVVHDGRTYLFPGEDQKQMFLDSPQAYVPVLNGDCVVCFAKMHERVPASVRYGAYHQGRLYFFASQEQKEMFLQDPQVYANVDLALGGECPVCRVEMSQRTPGSPQVSLIDGGLRYRFGSEEHRKMFQENRAKYRAAPQMAAGSSGTRRGGSHARGAGGASRPAGSAPRGSSGR